MIAVDHTHHAEPSGRASEPRLRTRQRAVRVLLAEDDEGLRAYVKRWLEVCKIEVLSASNGFELVYSLSDWILGAKRLRPVDVLVMDVRMPGFDGMSMLDWMQVSGVRLPTVLFSSVRQQELNLRHLPRADVLYLPEPMQLARLERRVRELARR